MRKFIDIAGKQFGRWLVIKKSYTRNKRWHWLCLCNCGQIAVVNGTNLRRGRTTSCGCLFREGKIKHGMCTTKTYKIWVNMRLRCNNANCKEYKNYGGRGIKVCKRWNKFLNFYKDMGEKPAGLSIERIDNNGNYEPTNCKWATPKEQSRNSRQNRMITYKGKTQCMKIWSEELSINYFALKYRLDNYPPEIAFNM